MKNVKLVYFWRTMNARSSTPLIRINSTRHTHSLVHGFHDVPEPRRLYYIIS